jgi:D-cysteine desulfhydrase family pyridoxal phosphate-dependent enzyme
MKTLPCLRFAHLPTTVESLPRLAAELGLSQLLCKRDDQTGLALGGNKTRKLEFLLAEAQANGARTLVTAGAVQSNHCRQTAAAAARFGFDCILVLSVPEGEQPEAYANTASGNLLLDRLLGAKIIWTSRSERDLTLKEIFDTAWANGKRPYLIPYGGSSPAGAAAYAFAVKEMLEQGVNPDWIVFASSSGGTQAGLVLGTRIFGYTGKVLGISVDELERVLAERVARLASDTADYLSEQIRFNPEDILVNANYLGEGYGVMSAAEKDAIEIFARSEGLLLDPVYTGRAAAGMIDLARGGFFPKSDSVLFWHTGGTPALFADRYKELA